MPAVGAFFAGVFTFGSVGVPLAAAGTAWGAGAALGAIVGGVTARSVQAFADRQECQATGNPDA